MDNEGLLIPKSGHHDKKAYKRRKIIVLGPPGVGKSSLISRFKDNIFLDFYEPTIQNTVNKKFKLNDEVVDLEIIDMDGQTDYTIFTFNKFAYGIHGYLIVYSIDNRQTFELAKIINNKLASLIGKKVPRVIVGNKKDLTSRRDITSYEGKEFADSIGCPFMECSAKESENVKDAFCKLLIEINKSENQVNVKDLKCFRLLECFVKNEKTMKSLLLSLFIINIIIGLVSLGFGVYLGMNEGSRPLPHYLPLLVHGLLTIIFSVIGGYGGHKKKATFLYFHNFGVVSEIVAVIIALSTAGLNTFTYEQTAAPFKFYTYYTPLVSLYALVICFMTNALAKIYKMDLMSFII